MLALRAGKRKMALTLLERYLAYADAARGGIRAAGVANGLTLSGGEFWTRIKGGYNLYRSEGETPDPANAIIVGAAAPTAETPTRISLFPGYALKPSTVYRFWVHAVSPGGAEEALLARTVRIETDAEGVPIDPVPAAPYQLTARPAAAGYIRLTWLHRASEVPLWTFNIYHDNGTGTVDYNTPLDSGRRQVALVGPYRHGTAVKFGVRAESADGAEEKNTNTATGTADAEGPPDLPAVSLTEGIET